METINLITTVSQGDGNIVHVDFFPTNTGLISVVSHGTDLPLVGSLATTISTYMPTAVEQVWIQAEAMFPGQFTT